MRLGQLLLVTAGLAVLPYVGRRFWSHAGSRAMIATALLSLVGMAASSVFLLAAVINPPDLPVGAIPGIVEQCVDAAGSIFAHPLQQWPRIGATILLLGVLVRAIFAIVMTCRDATKGARRIHLRRELFAASSVGDQGSPLVEVLDHDQPVAYAIGLIRRRIVVSSGLLDRLQDEQYTAVLAHEGAHVKGWHALLLFVGRSVARAFGFLPPVRRAADELVLALEIAADEAAAACVGSRLVVAHTLVRCAELTSESSPQAALSVAESELLFRVRRLTDPSTSRKRQRVPTPGIVLAVVAGCLVLVQFLVFPASARAISAATEVEERHQACHLPHVGTHTMPRS
jgi:bla regulator protein blaR1